MNRVFRWAGAVCVAMVLATGAGAADLSDGSSYTAGQEVVLDFGALVPMLPAADQASPNPAPASGLERVTTAVPWGRGMTLLDGSLVVLSRGRHRGEGGPSQAIVDHAGVLWKVDVSVAEPVVPGRDAGEAVRTNAVPWIEPTSPPFFLYDHATAPADDTLMSRPYCALVHDPRSQNLYVCAYAGAELETGFRKHATDAVYRYDLRDEQWHVVEQHDPASVPADALKAVISNAYYPHHDPATNPPPHGWTNGPDGCAAVGEYLYVPAKDNHLVVQYDLNAIRDRADAPPPDSRPVLGPEMLIRYPGGSAVMPVLGPSGVAVDEHYLYVSYRTSSVVVRVRLDENGDVVRPASGPVEGELIAVFEPWNRETRRSGNLYDIVLGPDGDLFVSMGTEGRVWRITPDPQRPFFGNDRTDRPTTAPPFVDMTTLVGRKTGCNNIYASPDGWLYISSRNNDTGAGDIHGTIYRAKIQ